MPFLKGSLCLGCLIVISVKRRSSTDVSCFVTVYIAKFPVDEKVYVVEMQENIDPLRESRKQC